MLMFAASAALCTVIMIMARLMAIFGAAKE
jgi:hypothetical protein